MDLQAQIQLLIDNAPKDGVTPQLIASIAPALIAIASSLRYPQYYILQNSEEDWVFTTLSNRTNPELEKRVIYAFPTIQDIPVTLSAGLDPQIILAPILVTHLLFQLLALDPVDSIVFFETPATTTKTKEIKRVQLQKLVQEQVQQMRSRNPIPPDIA
ncbi:hypothetical protein G7B40_028370 [Aetokthonos hydrillicola Thurmond2011]|jgi:hypothetical protein|uniref:Uncharacterized protein n=1 Tax=Aetokthonos hydrillicola Thurmond2011 TaxID=2712845 RepID=A0AAP5MAS6_9CYAN|nr:hypothetical protein [Aetokthonos hydrillicola]MBO3458126.1 hypothetical protein [Aetokthonos hydrillicola CCALA 1050]MBW4584347.1 hypothetical protein [Aetokthonos hydrillicola CCALA 1050]MDR9898445.1 hypothetical protein [Aetokthonos hydrillicola Thurmond2011]